jgi:hypothetical protein
VPVRPKRSCCTKDLARGDESEMKPTGSIRQ